MKRARPTYPELMAENAQLQRQVAELENLVRGLTQQVAEVLRNFGAVVEAVQIFPLKGAPKG
ncbi:MAG: hypothetical protein A3F84_06380 [Candidatus Handelsmanbacteria bacterium RIFCSPLOWO2_12_FULL_64_10]|uniref:Uncharacterized protein n=1 Tax=Handelsmanbacteria sp. (strain RIFCSPLOWO2_12_FULL_64_10) TaxID=1817868 RepID=A0A1F6CR02_HANXR|nr:MAG: hypothetical protein A3F84_06380 [Candidatus Handelsmanbacteria bacterium RIFCSPLOWO2_12_FULL_64_10]